MKNYMLLTLQDYEPQSREFRCLLDMLALMDDVTQKYYLKYIDPHLETINYNQPDGKIETEAMTQLMLALPDIPGIKITPCRHEHLSKVEVQSHCYKLTFANGIVTYVVDFFTPELCEFDEELAHGTST